MTLTDTIRNMFSFSTHTDPDPELQELRKKKVIADRRYKNGVNALRAMNQEANGVTRLRNATRKQLQSATELRRELKSEPGI